MIRPRLAVIGGSGLYSMEGLQDVEEVEVPTPYGSPSDAIVVGTFEGVGVAFLPRHGRGHRISPTNLPVKANIFALKRLGVERIVSVSAVGSLREEMKPSGHGGAAPDNRPDSTSRQYVLRRRDGCALGIFRPLLSFS